MKQVKLIGLTLLAVFALGALAAASAPAEEGFLPKQVLANVLGKETLVETASKEAIACKELDASHVEFTSDNHFTSTLQWLGCKAGGLFAVNSLGDKEGVILAKFLFLVCLDPKNSSGTLIDPFGIVAETDEPVHLETPALGILESRTGRLLGAVLTTGPAKLWIVEFSGVGGSQTVHSCLQGTVTLENTLTSEKNHNGKPEATSVEIKSFLLQFPEEVKLEDS